MPGLTWDCSCGSTNLASSPICPTCGRTPDASDVSPARAPLPFTASNTLVAPSAAPPQPVAVPSPTAAAEAEPSPWDHLAVVDHTDADAALLAPEPPPAEPGWDTWSPAAEAAWEEDPSPVAVMDEEPAPRKPSFWDPEPEVQPKGFVKESRFEGFRVGYVIVAIALIAALVVVAEFVKNNLNAKPPNPDTPGLIVPM